MAQQTQQDQGSSMQQFLEITEIRDGVVILKDSSLRMVLAASSINFDLKSDREQEAIVFAYQQFLNSLDFPLQIVVSSRRFNIDPYIHQLDQRKKMEHNDLLKNQIEDYIDFVKEFVEVSNIMSKTFYVVVPFYPIESKKGSVFDRFSNMITPQKRIYQKNEEFQTYKNQLFQRVEQIKEALSGTGVRMVPLNTQELIELYYNYYNPSGFENINISDMEEVEVQ
jgi:hypothetical protein